MKTAFNLSSITLTIDKAIYFLQLITEDEKHSRQKSDNP